MYLISFLTVQVAKMFLQLRPRDPIVEEYRRLRNEMDDLLAPAMYIMQQVTQPRLVIPKAEDKNGFEVKLDVQQFTPEELNVKMIDNFVVIEGKHEEKEDEHGFVSRHFVRKYKIPDDVKSENITCNLSSDGILLLSAPRMIEEPKVNERTVPINFTGKPAVISKKESEKTETGEETRKDLQAGDATNPEPKAA
jgi:HSP20 family molecular chaperone IbpA